jgi:hypothetical protein
MYPYETGSLVALLDIGVVIYRIPPGCSNPSEVPNVTQTDGRSPCHDDFGRSDEPEDGDNDAQQRRSDYGEWQCASSACALEEW